MGSASSAAAPPSERKSRDGSEKDNPVVRSLRVASTKESDRVFSFPLACICTRLFLPQPSPARRHARSIDRSIGRSHEHPAGWPSNQPTSHWPQSLPQSCSSSTAARASAPPGRGPGEASTFPSWAASSWCPPRSAVSWNLTNVYQENFVTVLFNERLVRGEFVDYETKIKRNRHAQERSKSALT